ncbi:MAG: YceD family protein [Bacilli bacterium]|nr:YceD family protein [Bacilli bacterium]MDD2681491.1 YceD family protein [Bacilli bacterium]MDD3121571.1 YceD family protein [Bacilli bacterium]MDD4062930.1 YceD family protein [Bacilli bacterium]MDD4482288.1 YceD family protein [Bacilli bacterium]
MKWSLQQLFKYNDKSFDFDFTIDLYERIKNIDDIIDISLVHVKGTGKKMNDRYYFDLNINTILILEDAVTLDSLEFPINLNVTEIFSIKEDYEEDVRIIETNTIDLTDVIWENILLEKPMRVTKSIT